MRRDKRERWALNRNLPNVHEPDLAGVVAGDTYLLGQWGDTVFGGPRPLTLELGCGQGLFAVDLAQRHPDQGVIGVDVKGHRFWRGAQFAETERVPNVAFLRTRIQWLDRYFAKDEVDSIWLTFSDPQVHDKRGTKCLVSPYYQRLYGAILRPGGRVYVKTDSPEFYERAQASAEDAGMRVADACADVHGAPADRFSESLKRSLAFVTAFEQRWIELGRSIHFVELESVERDSPEKLEEALRMLQGPGERSKPRFYGC